jgi:DNA-directed RNA polymerase specialized sigma24 family protein
MSGKTCVDVLQRDIMEDAYAHMEKLIQRTCWKFTKRYGGDFYEWLSEANMIFIDACRTHNGKSSLITWLYYKLHWGLYNVLRAKSREQKTQHQISFEELGTEDISVEDLFSAPNNPAIEMLMRNVGESSRELWGLILDPPEELRGMLDENQPEQSWDGIRRYCEYKLRWTWAEMQTAITELREICTE